VRTLVFLVAAGMFVASQGASAGATSSASSQNIQSAIPTEEHACSDPSMTSPKALGAHSVSGADYPQDAKSLSEQGDVVVSFLIHADGGVTDPVVERSSGSPRLDTAAANLVTHWRYEPATQAGTPMSCRQRAKVVWRLTDVDNVVDADPRYYPPQYREHGVQAETSFWVSLDEDGNIVSVRAMMSSGDPQLDEAGLSFLKSVKFTAAKMSGKSIQTAVPIKVRWSPIPVKSP